MLRDLTVAVTGARGFVASHLIPMLRARGARLVGVLRPGRDAPALERQGVVLRHGDLDDPDALAGVFDGIDAVVHLSGLAQVTGLVPVLEASGVRRGVFVSSAGVHTRLESRSADAKRAGEAALAASTIAWTILRPSMIYGTPADRNMVRLLRWVRRFPVVPVPGGGGTPQQPVHVEDLAAAIVTALERPGAVGRAYDVGGPRALPLREIIRLCARAVGRRALVVPVPLGPAHAAVVALRGLRLPCPVRPEQVLRLAESKAVDIGPATADLDFRPRPFEDAIEAEAGMLQKVSS